MKATINGITLDGTPAEIAEYQRLMEPKSMFKDFREMFEAEQAELKRKLDSQLVKVVRHANSQKQAPWVTWVTMGELMNKNPYN